MLKRTMIVTLILALLLPTVAACTKDVSDTIDTSAKEHLLKRRKNSRGIVGSKKMITAEGNSILAH